MSGLVVAAAQAVSARGDVDANLAHHRELADEAIAEGAQLVVFPELSLTGYELDLAEELAFSADDPRLQGLVNFARAREITLVVGAPVHLASGLHIGAFLLEPGVPPKIYTKRFLGEGEAAYFVSGQLDPLVRLRDSVGALAICADTNHAEHADAAASRGAELYLAGVFFDPTYFAEGVSRLKSYAATHSMMVLMANSGAGATGFEAAGGSAVWSESGEVVAQLDGAGPGLVVARKLGPTWTGRALRP